MKISTQEEGQPKQIFLTFKEAAASIGVPSPHIYAIIKRDNPRYKRRSDGKVFFLSKKKLMENFAPFVEKISNLFNK